MATNGPGLSGRVVERRRLHRVLRSSKPELLAIVDHEVGLDAFWG